MTERLNQLRTELARLQEQLIEAEAGLADRLAEINAFEFEFEAKVGHLIDRLEALEREIERYNERIQMARNKEIFGNPYVSVETQYRRTWQAPSRAAPTPPPVPLSPANEAEIKQIYRQLARRFHPDLAANEVDRLNRTQKMVAINDAYAARSLVELVALAQQAETRIDTGRSAQSEEQMHQALEAEMARCRRRLREIEQEIRGLSRRASVELSLEVKSARRQRRDLLAELAAGYEQKIARQTVERDMLRAQFDQLGPDQGFIPLDKFSR